MPLRNQDGWSQEKLATVCQLRSWDISLGVVARIEGGVRWIADFEQFARATAAPVNFLVILSLMSLDFSPPSRLHKRGRRVVCRDVGRATLTARSRRMHISLSCARMTARRVSRSIFPIIS